MKDEQFIKAAGFWDRKDAEEKKMDPEEVLKEAASFLESHKICALATGGGANIRVTPLEYTAHDGAVWIFSEGGRKFLGLRENPIVSLSVFETNPEFGKLHSLQMTGEASVLDNPNDPAYQREAEIRKIPMEALRELKEPMYLIRIRPAEIMVLNSELRKRGYGSRQTVSVSG